MPPGKKSEKGSTVAGNGKGATRFGPTRPATTGAVRERARRGTLESKKKPAPERCPARKPGGKARKSREQREPTTRARMSWEKFRKTEKCCEASIQGQLRAVQMRMARRRKRRRAVQGTRKGIMNASVKMYENMIKYVT